MPYNYARYRSTLNIVSYYSLLLLVNVWFVFSYILYFTYIFWVCAEDPCPFNFDTRLCFIFHFRVLSCSRVYAVCIHFNMYRPVSCITTFTSAQISDAYLQHFLSYYHFLHKLLTFSCLLLYNISKIVKMCVRVAKLFS